MGTDTDGTQPFGNAIFAIPGGWTDSSDFGISGDFIIRAVVDCIEIECPFDLDGSETIDFGDIVQVLTSWGPCAVKVPECPADLDGNGEVAFGDLIVLLTAWGPCV